MDPCCSITHHHPPSSTKLPRTRRCSGLLVCHVSGRDACVVKNRLPLWCKICQSLSFCMHVCMHVSHMRVMSQRRPGGQSNERNVTVCGVSATKLIVLRAKTRKCASKIKRESVCIQRRCYRCKLDGTHGRPTVVTRAIARRITPNQHCSIVPSVYHHSNSSSQNVEGLRAHTLGGFRLLAASSATAIPSDYILLAALLPLFHGSVIVMMI